jgi:hypothetical protein
MAFPAENVASGGQIGIWAGEPNPCPRGLFGARRRTPSSRDTPLHLSTVTQPNAGVATIGVDELDAGDLGQQEPYSNGRFWTVCQS